MSRNIHLYITNVAAAAGGSGRGPPRGLVAQQEVNRNGDALDTQVKGALKLPGGS
jgi:hypothetical protein